MTPLAAYMLLFLAVGVGFIFVHLLAGKLIRPNRPHSEKATIYECGEPTIGSAWVQFDLRFYVVALLFVIFDVEVAFFFPWAEVFGKANAIANAREPKTAEDYQELVRRVDDLAIPEGFRAQAWQRLRELKPKDLQEELDARDRLKEAATPEQGQETGLAILRNAPQRVYEQAQRINARQRELLKENSTKLNEALAKVRADQEAATGKLIVALEKLPQNEKNRLNLETLVPLLKEEPNKRWRTVRTKSLEELRTLGKDDLNVLTAVPNDAPALVRNQLNRVAGQPVKELDGLVNREHEELNKLGGELLDRLNAAGPDQKELWAIMTSGGMKSLGALTAEQVEALARLSQPTLRALEGTVGDDVRSEARSLAWVALIEVLVFFGVLLVGFAYLWLRGDLAWVRSVAAERGQGASAAIPPPGPRSTEMVISGKP